MTDSCKTTVLVGVAGGYLLGRTKKARLALALAALVTGRRLAPRDLLDRGVRSIVDAPQLAGLSDQVKDQMMTAARTAVDSLVDRRVASVTDSLRARTDRLGAPEGEREARDAGEDGDHDGEDRERRSSGSKRKAPARRAAGTSRPAASRPRKKTAAGGGSGGAKGSGGSGGKKPSGRTAGRQRS